MATERKARNDEQRRRDRDRARAWRAANPGVHNARQKARLEAQREHINALRKKRREERGEAYRAVAKAWIEKNRERVNQKSRETWNRHREKYLRRKRDRWAADAVFRAEKNEKSRAWARRNREWIQAYVRERLKLHPEKFIANNAMRRAREHAACSDPVAVRAWVRDQHARESVSCHWCGRSTNRGRDRHIDHVIPLKLGGKHDLENLVVACQTCNSRKQGLHPQEWSARLKQERCEASNG